MLLELYQVIWDAEYNNSNHDEVLAVNVTFEEGRKVIADNVNKRLDSMHLPHSNENETALYHQYSMRVIKKIEEVDAKVAYEENKKLLHEKATEFSMEKYNSEEQRFNIDKYYGFVAGYEYALEMLK